MLRRRRTAAEADPQPLCASPISFCAIGMAIMNTRGSKKRDWKPATSKSRGCIKLASRVVCDLHCVQTRSHKRKSLHSMFSFRARVYRPGGAFGDPGRAGAERSGSERPPHLAFTPTGPPGTPLGELMVCDCETGSARRRSLAQADHRERMRGCPPGRGAGLGPDRERT
jgi:hypothetical protein